MLSAVLFSVGRTVDSTCSGPASHPGKVSLLCGTRTEGPAVENATTSSAARIRVARATGPASGCRATRDRGSVSAPSGARRGNATDVSPCAAPATGAVVALTVLAAVLRFAWIGHQGFWFDEANTALLVHLSPGKMLGLIPQSESTPPLYYCLAWLWARLFGYGEAPLRSLSAVA